MRSGNSAISLLQKARVATSGNLKAVVPGEWVYQAHRAQDPRTTLPVTLYAMEHMATSPVRWFSPLGRDHDAGEEVEEAVLTQGLLGEGGQSYIHPHKGQVGILPDPLM